MQAVETLTKEQLADAVRSVPYWFHSIDLGGIVTPGHKSKAELDQESACFPDVAGKSVLDLGAWDGAHTFWAERNNASRVVALDQFAWAIDRQAQERHKAMGLPVYRWEDTDSWNPETLPGKAGFDLAHRILGSRAETVVADFMSDDLDGLGTFDVVLFLGQLYHHQDPVRSLRKVYHLTKEVAVIESASIYFHGYDDHELCKFANGQDGSFTNWFIPNLQAIKAMCCRAGFSRVEVVRGPPQPVTSKLRSITTHALREAGLRSKLEPAHYRAMVHAWATKLRPSPSEINCTFPVVPFHPSPAKRA